MTVNRRFWITDFRLLQEANAGPFRFGGCGLTFFTACQKREYPNGRALPAGEPQGREYIDGRCRDQSISRHTVADHVGINPNHLSAVFSRETGFNDPHYFSFIFKSIPAFPPGNGKNRKPKNEASLPCFNRTASLIDIVSLFYINNALNSIFKNYKFLNIPDKIRIGNLIL
jgi:hypothetical protein